MYRHLFSLFVNQDLGVLLGAGALCLLATFLAFLALSRAHDKLRPRLGWIWAAAAVAGIGSWSMHVMVAFGYSPGVPLSYDIMAVILAAIPAVLNTGIGFIFCKREKGSTWIAGVFVGAGFAMMQFMWMSAISVVGTVAMHWDLVVLSVALCMGLSLAAVALYRRESRVKAIYPALLLALAIFSLHFLATAALEVRGDARIVAPQLVLDSGTLSLLIGATSLAILSITLCAALLDRVGVNRELAEAAKLKRLADEVIAGAAERERLLGELKRQIEISTAALDNMVHGLTMYDEREHLIIFNRRYVEMFEVPDNVLIPGMSLDAVLRHHVETGQIPGHFLTGRIELSNDDHDFKFTMSNGRIVNVRRRPLESGGWVITHEDVTEREQLLDELKRQNDITGAALDNMTHGLSMYDEGGRLVIFNRRYAEMYEIRDDVVTPGTSLDTMVRHHVESGQIPLDFVQWELEHKGTKPRWGHRELLMRNGRIMDVHVTPLESGGWITTHEDVTERRRASDRIAYLATHDELTGLPNRRSFTNALQDAVASAGEGRSFSLLTVDLDRFKEVNDTLGHPFGDEILREAASRLQSITDGEDVITRLGGDEFAILQQGVAAADRAEQLAAEVVTLLAQPFEFEGHTLTVGATVGIAIASDSECDAEEIVQRSDLALYHAKSQSRGSYSFFEPGMDARLREWREMESGLRLAIRKGEFELYYQPQLDLASQTIAGFEALVRWHHPTRGVLTPTEFIPAAEASGLIIPIGEWVLRQACRDAARWPSPLHVSVNLSAAQLKRGDLLTMTKSALGAAGLAPERLEIELTESVLLHDEEWVRSLLLQLRQFGVRIAMDDFGTGYSSLSYLRTFPFSKIKIDKSFVSDMVTNSDALAIVQATIGLSMKLGMTTTAEGVETSEQLDVLAAEGCREIQGYFISRPVPADQIEQILRRYGPAKPPLLRAAS